MLNDTNRRLERHHFITLKLISGVEDKTAIHTRIRTVKNFNGIWNFAEATLPPGSGRGAKPLPAHPRLRPGQHSGGGAAFGRGYRAL